MMQKIQYLTKLAIIIKHGGTGRPHYVDQMIQIELFMKKFMFLVYVIENLYMLNQDPCVVLFNN